VEELRQELESRGYLGLSLAAKKMLPGRIGTSEEDFLLFNREFVMLKRRVCPSSSQPASFTSAPIIRSSGASV